MSWTVTTLSADPHVPPLTPLDFTEGRAGEAAETRRRAGVDVQPGTESTSSARLLPAHRQLRVGSRVRTELAAPLAPQMCRRQRSGDVSRLHRRPRWD